MRKIISKAVSVLLYLLFSVSIYRLITMPSPPTLFLVILNDVIVVFSIELLVLPPWMTLKYDRQFKKGLIEVANADPWMQIYPISIDFLMHLRYTRGFAYTGAVLTASWPKFFKSRVAYQKYLVNNPQFVKKISWADNVLATFLFITIVILGLLGIIYYLQKWFDW